MENRDPCILSLTEYQVRQIATMINNFATVSLRLTQTFNPDALKQAIGSLNAIKKAQEPLLKQLSTIARITGSENPGRLIEDVERIQFGAEPMLKLAIRCMHAVAFLSHIIVLHTKPAETEAPANIETAEPIGRIH
jgi:hypothetical protein